MNPKQKAIEHINRCREVDSHDIEAIEVAIEEQTKEIFKQIEDKLYHRDKDHFEFNSEATFRKLEEIKKEYIFK